MQEWKNSNELEIIKKANVKDVPADFRLTALCFITHEMFSIGLFDDI